MVRPECPLRLLRTCGIRSGEYCGLVEFGLRTCGIDCSKRLADLWSYRAVRCGLVELVARNDLRTCGIGIADLWSFGASHCGLVESGLRTCGISIADLWSCAGFCRAGRFSRDALMMTSIFYSVSPKNILNNITHAGATHVGSGRSCCRRRSRYRSSQPARLRFLLIAPTDPS